MYIYIHYLSQRQPLMTSNQPPPNEIFPCPLYWYLPFAAVTKYSIHDDLQRPNHVHVEGGRCPRVKLECIDFITIYALLIWFHFIGWRWVFSGAGEPGTYII